MKLPLLSLVALFLLLAACERADDDRIDPDAEPEIEFISYGEAIPEDGPALAPRDLDADPHGYHGQTVRVRGDIIEVCRQQGCWLALDNPAGDPVRVKVPRVNGEYAWVVPTDLGRLPAIVEGTAFADTLSVDDLRHFAEDAGRPEAEIEAIDEGRIAANITARGILVERPRGPVGPETGQPGDDAAREASAY